MPTSGTSISPEPLHVILTRDMFSIFFLLQTPVNGYSEELEAEEVREWFKQRGAKEEAVNAAMDQCWNFLRSEIVIKNPKEPAIVRLPYSPDI